MSRIDPLRLSRVLASLARPKGERVAGQESTPRNATRRDEIRNTARLREAIGQRLRKIRDHDDFQSLAPIITVQEILCWEFGVSVLEHAEFDRVMQAVLKDMFADEQAHAIFQRIISNLASPE